MAAGWQAGKAGSPPHRPGAGLRMYVPHCVGVQALAKHGGGAGGEVSGATCMRADVMGGCGDGEAAG